MTKKKRSASRDEEWVVGMRVLPLLLDDHGERVQPEVLVWIGEDGALLGQLSARAGAVLERVIESFEATVRSPLVGAPRRPSRVRTQSLDVAEALRRAGVRVEVSATPEFDDTIDALLDEAAAEIVRETTSYIATGVNAAEVASFFDAAAALARSDPWEILQEGDRIAVTIESLDARELVVVFSRSDATRELVVYDGVAEYDALVSDDDDPFVDSEREPLGGYWELQWLRGAALSDELRREVMRNGWAVAASDAYPWLIRVGRGAREAPLTARDFAVIEAVMLGVDAVLSAAGADAVDAALSEPSAKIERAIDVASGGGVASVSVRIPFDAIAPVDWVRAWLDAEDAADIDAIDRVNAEVLIAFTRSPEGRGAPDQGGALFLLDFLADPKEPRTVASLDAAELFEIVVVAMPMVFDAPPTDAPLVVEGLRAFYRFLTRVLELPGAEECYAALGGLAERLLADALAKRAKGKRGPRASGAKRAKKGKRG